MAQLPHDYPLPDRPHRMYAALTNHCNRSCPWCSTCSSPKGSTWLSVNDFIAGLPAEGLFQIQLEGGEPTIHPQFWEFVRLSRENARCTRLVICTNGVVLPRNKEKLFTWVERLGVPLTLKLSINHHLLDRDSGLLSRAVLLRDLFGEMGGERILIINVRLRSGYEDGDRRVRESVEQAGLMDIANVFFLQSYGFASEEKKWEPPSPVANHFSLVNPDGKIYGYDLIARSESMRKLP